MQPRIITEGRPSRYAAVAGMFAIVLFALLLTGCQTPPPPKKPPTLAERQVEALHSLGFIKKDEGWLMSLPEPISFELSQSRLKPEMQKSLDGFAGLLLNVEIRHLLVEGHTDNTGTRQYNLDLSRNRAEAVAQEFIAHGFAGADVERIGLGPDHPATSNDTRDGRAINRRVEIVVPANALAPTQ